MQLSVINEIISGRIVHALCWMLVHSLWLGLALTVVTGAIIVTTKNKTAALRYNLLSGALVLFTISVGIAFMLQLLSSQPASEIPNADVPTSLSTISKNPSLVAGTATGFSNKVSVFFNDNAAVVVCCWFLIIAMRCAQFAGGLYKIRQIKTTQLTPVSEYWNGRLAHFADALKIKANIQLLQSGLAKMPLVVGHFKPVILFPFGLITSLPAAEVEAVLLHELAHIRRKDYLVNLLQHCTEILFFFNPAVLWVSSLIKMERENCCDDIAVALADSKKNYINALVSFQEYQLNATTHYATALGNNKNQLLQRIKRILYNNNKTLTNMEKTFLAVCFVATTLLAILFSTETTAQTNGAANKATRDTRQSAASKQDKALNKKIEAETLALKIQQEKLNAEQSELLNQLEKLKTEQQATSGVDSTQLQKKMLELQEQLERLKLKLQQQQQLSNADAIKSAQLQSLTHLDKLRAEQLQLQVSQEKLRAEKLNKDVQLQNRQTELQKKEQAFKIEAEEKQMELDVEKQKAEQRQLQIELEEAAKEQQQAAIEQKQAALEQQQAAKDQQQAAIEYKQAAIEYKQVAVEHVKAVKEQKQAVKEQRKAAKEQKKAADEQQQSAKEEAKENEKHDK